MVIEDLKLHAKNIRKNILRQVYGAQSGHPGGSLGATDILTVLYFDVMDINKESIVIVSYYRRDMYHHSYMLY